jgi:hypothetical protein
MYRWESDDPNYGKDVNLLDEYENPPENYEPQHPDLSVPLSYLMNPDLFDSEEYEFEPSGSRKTSVDAQRAKIKKDIKDKATAIHKEIIELKDMLVTLLKLGGDKNVVADIEKEVKNEDNLMEKEIKDEEGKGGAKATTGGEATTNPPTGDNANKEEKDPKKKVAKGTENKDGKGTENKDGKGTTNPPTGDNANKEEKDPGKVKKQSAEEIAAAEAEALKKKKETEAAAAKAEAAKAEKDKKDKAAAEKDKAAKAPVNGAKKKAKF